MGGLKTLKFLMFGTHFAKYPEILLNSLKGTSKSYAARYSFRLSPFKKFFFKTYVAIFGIPEIGFQVRTLYFLKTLKNLKNFAPKKILDAGSGIGFYAFLLNKLYPKAKITGVDSDYDKIKFCKLYAKNNSLKNIEFFKKDLTKFTKIQIKYDLIVNIDVLEHIENYNGVLKNFYNMLAVGGYLYIHTPQVEQKRIFKKFFAKWHHKEHVREGFELTKLKQELESVGFKKVKCLQAFGFWGSLAWELNHITLSKNLLLAGLVFPLVYFLARLDTLWLNKKGLTFSLLARK